MRWDSGRESDKEYIEQVADERRDIKYTDIFISLVKDKCGSVKR